MESHKIPLFQATNQLGYDAGYFRASDFLDLFGLMGDLPKMMIHRWILRCPIMRRSHVYGNHKIDGTLGTGGTVGNPFHEQQEIRNAKNGNNWNWWCIVSNILANNVWFVDKTGFFVLLQLLHWTPIGINSWRNMSLLGVQSLEELKLIEVDLMVFHHWGRQQMAGTQPLSSPNSQGQGTGVEIMQQVGSYMMLHGDSKYFFMV